MLIKRKPTKYMIFVLWIFAITVNAQNIKTEQLGLKDCLKRTIDNNTSIRVAQLDEQKMHWKIVETRGSALPQINGIGTFDDYMKLPTSLIPGEFFGQPGTMIPVQFGTKYNVTGGISATQLLYSQTFNTSLELANQMKELTALSTEKVKYEMIANVAKLYYLSLATLSQKKTLEKNELSLEKLATVSRLQSDSGLIRGIDADRVNVNVINLQTNLQSINTLYSQQLNTLKYFMGMDPSTSIELTDSISSVDIAGLSVAANDKHIDLQLIQKQFLVEKQTLNVMQSQRYPSLSAYGRYNNQSMDDKFKFFDSGSKWYKTSVIGLSLTIPIFNGLQNTARVQQSRINMESLKLKEDDTKRNLETETLNAHNKYLDCRKSWELQNSNVNLANKVFDRTREQYKEGITSLSDLLQAESAMREAESSQIQAILQMKIAEIDLLKANGNLLNILN
jgi:outer membrane protein